MIFKNIFKRKSPQAVDFSFLGTDIHSHILPAIDDGAADVDQSLFLINSLRQMGFSTLLATPHIISDLYPNNRQTISHSLSTLTFDKTDISFAAEYMVDLSFDELLLADNLLSFGDKYILIEMSYAAESPNIWNAIFDLKVKGYQPILAHPERYNFYHSKTEVYKKIKDTGCLMQLNLLSITGYYGKFVRSVALDLIKKEFYDFAGTDAHHDRHIHGLKMMNQRDLELLQQYNFRNKTLNLS